MDPQNFFQSKKFKWLTWFIAAFIVLLLVFQAGMFVGLRKARFSYAWGENYHKMFGGPRDGFLRDFSGDEFISGHGTVGSIAKIDENALIIKGRDGAEKIVNISDNTGIRKGLEQIKTSNLKVGQQIIIIGEPREDGSIDARILRVFEPGRMSGLKLFQPNKP